VQAEEVSLGIARRLDEGDPQGLSRSVVAKLLMSRAAISAVSSAVAAIGNPGLTRNNALERHYRDVHCSRVHPPQEDAALILAGRGVLASYQA
jgi:alkylation response protein AidB-like acyl-CoA dehydrogenase